MLNWESLSVGGKLALILLGILSAAAVVLLLARVMPSGVDWETAYRPAAQAALRFENPYSVYGYYNAPWALLPLLPIAYLPVEVGRAIFLLMGILGFAYAAYKLGAKPLTMGLFMASPPVMHCLLNASIDWMPILGFVLPPRIGLFLVVIKPQVGAVVVLFWLVESWRKGGWRETVRVFWPVTAALLLSFVLFGLWPFRSARLVDLWWNASLWPASIPVGLALVVAALRKRNIRFAIGASPCLSPYVLLHSWSGALAAILPLPLETAAAVIGLWIMMLIRATAGL